MVLEFLCKPWLSKDPQAIWLPEPGKEQPAGIYQEHTFLYSKQFLTSCFFFIANHNAFQWLKNLVMTLAVREQVCMGPEKFNF